MTTIAWPVPPPSHIVCSKSAAQAASHLANTSGDAVVDLGRVDGAAVDERFQWRRPEVAGVHNDEGFGSHK